MPQIHAVSETALYVADVARSARFYEDVLGFRRLNGDERFCGLRVASEQVLILFRKGGSTKPVNTPGGVIPPHDGDGQLHVAFSIPPADFDAWQARLREKGITIESVVNWEGGLRSLYFRDPDNHLIELATPGLWKTG
jgi:catechol 2,3-dioxygenase-like lactoylglutathione lyase family enzyme